MWYTPNTIDGLMDKISHKEVYYRKEVYHRNDPKTKGANPYLRWGLSASLIVAPFTFTSCKNHTKKVQATSVVAPREYTLQDLEAALGERWYSLNNEQKDKFKELWFTNDSDFRGYMVEAYSKPQESYYRLSKERKKQFDAFTISELSKEEAKNYKEIFPWINIKNSTFSDKLLIFMLETIGYIANLR